MRKLAPLTKLLVTLLVTLWAFLFADPAPLGGVTAGLIAIAAASRLTRLQYKAMASLAVFAALLALLQYAFGTEVPQAINAGLRMLVMTYLFLLLLATTRIQDLTAALVKQCHIPYDYAFMLTATLRFIPDLLAEIKAVQEAQACRGYAPGGNFINRLVSYLSVVQPLVLRSISRSETMAMSLELRGFGNQKGRSFTAEMSLGAADYTVLAAVTAGTAAIVFTLIK